MVDSLVNSKLEVLNKIESITGVKPHFVQLDLCDKVALEDFLKTPQGLDVGSVIHFAAYKNVGESVSDPLKYYHNNIESLVNTLSLMAEFSIPHLVYSSSCSVYGNPDTSPVTEESTLKPAASPYGNTKKIGEDIIKDLVGTGTIEAIALRYFNPIGAHPSIEIGEYPTEFTDNLMPALTATVRGEREYFSVYGNDYPTGDGTCVRDYIDITDLAKAHVKAVARLINGSNEEEYEVFNLGTGQGVSVMEMIKMVEKVSGQPLRYEIKPRRAGDVEAIYANPDLANKRLNWHAQRSLEEMITTSWEWSGKMKRSNAE